MYRFSFESEATVGLRGAFTYIHRIGSSLSDVYLSFVFPPKRLVGSGNQVPYMHIFGSSDKGSSHPSTFSFVLEAPFLEYMHIPGGQFGSGGSPNTQGVIPGAPSSSPFIDRATAESLRFSSTNVVITVDASQIQNVLRMLFDKSSFLLLAELNVTGTNPADEAFLSSTSNVESSTLFDLDRIDSESRALPEAPKRYLSFQRALVIGRTKGGASRAERFEPRTCSSVVCLPVKTASIDMNSIAYFDLVSDVLRWEFPRLASRVKQTPFSIFTLLDSLSSLSTLPPSISLYSRLPIQRVQIPNPEKFLEQLAVDIKGTLSGKTVAASDVMLVSTASQLRFGNTEPRQQGSVGSEQHPSERYSREFAGIVQDPGRNPADPLDGFAFQTALESGYSGQVDKFFCPLVPPPKYDQSIWYSCGSSSHEVLQDPRARVAVGNPVSLQLLNYYEAKLAGQNIDDANLPVIPALESFAKTMRGIYPPRDSQQLQFLRHLASSTPFFSTAVNLAGESQTCALVSSFTAYPMFEWELSLPVRDAGAMVEEVKAAGSGLYLSHTRGLDMIAQRKLSAKCVGVARFQDLSVSILMKFAQPLRLRGDISLHSLEMGARPWAPPSASLRPSGNLTPGPYSQTQSRLTPFQRAPQQQSPSPANGPSFLNISEGSHALVGLLAQPSPEELPSQREEVPAEKAGPDRLEPQDASSIDLDTPSQPSVPRSSQLKYPHSLEPEGHAAQEDPRSTLPRAKATDSMPLAAESPNPVGPGAVPRSRPTTLSMIKATIAALRNSSANGRLGCSIGIETSRPNELQADVPPAPLSDTADGALSLTDQCVDDLMLRLAESGVHDDLDAEKLLKSQRLPLSAKEKRALEMLIELADFQASSTSRNLVPRAEGAGNGGVDAGRSAVRMPGGDLDLSALPGPSRPEESSSRAARPEGCPEMGGEGRTQAPPEAQAATTEIATSQQGNPSQPRPLVAEGRTLISEGRTLGTQAQERDLPPPELPSQGVNCLTFLSDSDDDLNSPVAICGTANDVRLFYSARYRQILALNGVVDLEVPAADAENVKITSFHSQAAI